jgi:hypothetical protein
LDFGVHRGGHEVDDPHLEGTYILVFRPVVGHDKNIFAPQGFVGGKGFWNLNRHRNTFYKKREKITSSAALQDPPCRVSLWGIDYAKILIEDIDAMQVNQINGARGFF